MDGKEPSRKRGAGLEPKCSGDSTSGEEEEAIDYPVCVQPAMEISSITMKGQQLTAKKCCVGGGRYSLESTLLSPSGSLAGYSMFTGGRGVRLGRSQGPPRLGCPQSDGARTCPSSMAAPGRADHSRGLLLGPGNNFSA